MDQMIANMCIIYIFCCSFLENLSRNIPFSSMAPILAHILNCFRVFITIAQLFLTLRAESVNLCAIAMICKAINSSFFLALNDCTYQQQLAEHLQKERPAESQHMGVNVNDMCEESYNLNAEHRVHPPAKESLAQSIR